MLRHLFRAGRNLIVQNNGIVQHAKPIQRYNLKLAARCFSTDLTGDWPQGIKSFLEREKITKPTPIQERTLPFVVDSKNLVGIARTGSGKTLAFVIPAVMKILKDRENNSQRSESPSCLILAPTRELAGQIADVCYKFRNMGIASISLVGGSSRSEQVRQLTRQNHDIYIATPGRLMDLIDTSVVDLSKIKYLVLDEADRMLDMGFEPQIRRIIGTMPDERQTLMFSATWPQEIQQLASEFLHDYEYVAVDSEILKANPNIKQIVEFCEPNRKLNILLNHLKNFQQEYEEPRALIFVNTKRLADMLLLQLTRNRMKAIALHGDRSQSQRDNALRLFKKRLCHIMVATDVAARGLDIDDITHVINFDFPNSIEDYIHRIGRTARHEKTGTALSLFTVNNINLVKKLIGVLRETNQEVPMELEDLARNRHKYNIEERSFRSRPRRDDFYEGSKRSMHGREEGWSQARPRAAGLSNRYDRSYDEPRRNNFFADEGDFEDRRQSSFSSNGRRQYGQGNDFSRKSNYYNDDDDDFDDERPPSSRPDRRHARAGSIFED